MGSGLHRVMGSGLHRVMGSGLHRVMGWGLHIVMGSGLHRVMGSGLHRVMGSGLHRVMSSGLHRVMGSDLHRVMGSGLHRVMGSGLHRKTLLLGLVTEITELGLLCSAHFNVDVHTTTDVVQVKHGLGPAAQLNLCPFTCCTQPQHCTCVLWGEGLQDL